MTIQTVRNFLTADTTITALVPATRIFLTNAIEGTPLPYIVITQIADTSQGMGNRELTAQISVFSSTIASGKGVVDRIKKRIEPPNTSTSFFASYVENMIDLYENDVKIYHYPITCSFHYEDRPTF